jgi:hypothetical protein
MRWFVKLSSGLFVVAGFLGFVISILAALASIHGGFFSLAVIATMIFGSASAALVGGTAYMLCVIDARLEKAFETTARAH